MVQVVDGIYSIDLSEDRDNSLECWLLRCPEEIILIDTGMGELSWNRIADELKHIGATWKDIGRILITHKHGDHINNLHRIQRVSKAVVMAHEGEVNDIKERAKVDIKGLRDGDTLDYCGGIMVVHIPGHTKGNCCYYLPKYKVMILGDTIFKDDKGNISPPPERYCLDAKQARIEIKQLLDYDFEILLITHGKGELIEAKKLVMALVERASK